MKRRKSEANASLFVILSLAVPTYGGKAKIPKYPHIFLRFVKSTKAVIPLRFLFWV